MLFLTLLVLPVKLRESTLIQDAISFAHLRVYQIINYEINPNNKSEKYIKILQFLSRLPFAPMLRVRVGYLILISLYPLDIYLTLKISPE